MNEYIFTVSGLDFQKCLDQLQSLDENPIGKVTFNALEKNISITRKTVSNNQATVDISGLGIWPFSVSMSWFNFSRLLLKDFTKTTELKIKISIKKSEVKFCVGGIYIPLDEFDHQFSLFSTETEDPSVKERDLYNKIIKRIQELDEINNKTVKKNQIIYERYERDQELNKLIKKFRGEKCQICGYFFQMQNGEKYVECHHLEHLSKGGLDVSKNILVLCANHHRQFHFGNIKILDHTEELLHVSIDNVEYQCSLK